MERRHDPNERIVAVGEKCMDSNAKTVSWTKNGYILANPEMRVSIPRSTLRQCLKAFFSFRSNFLTSESPVCSGFGRLISSQSNNACGARWHCAKWSCVV